MTDAREVLARLDGHLVRTRIAHQVVWGLHAELVTHGRAGDDTRALLIRSAHIATVEVPALVRRAQQLRALWFEQDLLDPAVAELTLAALDAEVRRIEPGLQAAVTEQGRAAAALRELWEPGF